MKRILILLATLLAVVTMAKEGCDTIYLREMGDANGTYYKFATTSDVVLKLPSWDPSKEQLPLAITDALAIAKKWCLVSHPKFDDVVLGGIEIEPIGWTTAKDKWFFIFSFDPIIDGQRLYGQFYAVVLMDGTVVEPKVSKEPSHP